MNDGKIVMNFDVIVMDADIGEGQRGVVNDGAKVGAKSDNRGDKTCTYASVTAKSMLEGSKQKPTVAAIDEEVLDEDEKVIHVADLNQGGKMHLQSVAPTIQPNKGENAGQTGREVNSMVHKHSLTSGSHAVIIIQEKGAMATGISGTKDKRLRNIGTKTMLGAIGHNFNGRKLAAVRAMGTMEVSKFIIDLTNHLDSFQDPSSYLMEKDCDDVELGGSEEGLSDSDSQDNDDHRADVILVEQ
ncbi:hypothetical protein V6N11_071409 [Hibiscus sabdariffa]|uniref:Uncharacterized protein n=1 Tax=Hibiscus sabdariffa TaxID=183260 RepID=A0ABR2U0U5_9ROSI